MHQLFFMHGIFKKKYVTKNFMHIMCLLNPTSMKTYAFYFLTVYFICISCKPINHSIGIREVYQYPNASSFKHKTLPDLNSMLQKPQQIFYIYSDTIIYGKEGTVISIQPSCLRTNDSNLYAGKITIHLKELYTKQALLRERAFTISNGNMLESDGSLYIDAQTETGKPLFIDCENGIQIRLPRDVKNNMTYFDGYRDALGNMNWELSNSINTIFEEPYFVESFDNYETDQSYLSETEKEVQTYFFTTKTFGWINCDRFYDDPRDKTDLLASFVLPDYEKNITETYNYIVFDSLMSVLPIYLDDAGQWICPSLPVGEAVTCISIQKSMNHLYCGIEKTQVGRSGLIVPLKEINEQELKILLDFTL